MSRVLIVVLDAMELSLIERWTDDGGLPHLSQLRSSAAFTELHSTADWWVASPWPTFYTGTSPADHGIYHYLVWNPEQMASRRPSAGYEIEEPFWRDLARRGLRTVVIDASMVFPAPEPDHRGIEICGWCTHDLLSDPWVHPNALRERLEGSGHRPVELVEAYHPMRTSDVREARQQLNEATRVVSEVSAELLTTEAWDFALVNLTASHQAGHQFFAGTGLAEPDGGREIAEEALRDVYEHCDAALGRVLATVPDDTTVLVTALHGMEPNYNRGNLLPEMLRMVLAERRRATPWQGLRTLVPDRWRRQIKQRLPRSWQDGLTNYWRTSEVDWENCKAFPFLPDLQGYVRINLAGREAQGIVAQGAEYDAVCQQILEGVVQFVDGETGVPIVERAVRTDTLFPSHPQLSRLPDIAIDWKATPASGHRRIVSPFGEIDWPTPGINPDGRSGNHRARGFLFRRSPNLEQTRRTDSAELVDLAPTVYELLGIDPPKTAQGRPIQF